MVIWLGGFGFFWSVNKTFKGEIDWKGFFLFYLFIIVQIMTRYLKLESVIYYPWKGKVFQNRWGIIIYYFSLNYSFNRRPSRPFGILLAHFHNSDALDQVSGYQPKEQKEIRTRLGHVLSKSSVKPYP